MLLFLECKQLICFFFLSHKQPLVKAAYLETCHWVVVTWNPVGFSEVHLSSSPVHFPNCCIQTEQHESHSSEFSACEFLLKGHVTTPGTLTFDILANLQKLRQRKCHCFCRFKSQTQMFALPLSQSGPTGVLLLPGRCC